MSNKTLDYYMSLPYTLEIIPSEEGGWFIKVKELRGCMTQADTWEELMPMIEEAKTGWLEVALEAGDPIPEPVGISEKAG
ncbi:MAG: type II toxin-antitoxin system HicB family antitoxin [Anaerolineae bacterium]|nr:type II toxin-antitoxin system HicB family antitoxin [Anaerolineae bacterium]